MISGLVLAAATIGQQAVVLGHRDGEGFSLLAVPVAVDEAAYRAAQIEVGDRDPNEVTQPVGLAVVARGTQVRIIKTTKLDSWADGRIKPIDGYLIEILEGPLASSRGVVAAKNTRTEAARDPAKTPAYAPKSPAALRVWLGSETAGGDKIGLLVAGSAVDLAGVGRLTGSVNEKGVRTSVATPTTIAQLGYGTRAEGLEIVPYETEADGRLAKRSACVVRVIDGPAAGRIVFVDGNDVHVDATRRQEELAKEAARQKSRRTARARYGKARKATGVDVP